MKRHITFPFSRRLFNAYTLALILLSAVVGYLWTIYPQPALHLTVFDHHQQAYLSRCPQLATAKLSAQEKQKTLPLPFTLLNWNIYKQQRTQWQQKLQEWSNSADLLTLQEVNYFPEFIYFSQKNNLFHLQNHAFQYKDNIYGVNTLSKVQPSKLCGTRDSEPWLRVPKTALASTYAIINSAESLLLINLHGVNFTFTSTALAEQLQPYLQLIIAHQGPIIFSGDFNTWSDARLASIEAPLLKLGFKEALFNKDQRSKIFGYALDHIYFRGLKVIEATSFTTAASDHNPQLVTFDIE